jgi:DNA repair exonuclease SbcCD ATPase subunit
VAKVVAAHIQGEHGIRNMKMAEEIQLLKAELRAAQSERLVLAAEVSQLATDKRKAIREREEAIESARRRTEQSEGERLELVSQITQRRIEKDQKNESERRVKDLETELERHRAILRGVEGSLSWRVTAPVRKTMEALRKIRN